MSEQLITVGEAAQKLGTTSSLPGNKCLTKAEFDELLNANNGYEPDKAPNGVYIMHKNGRLFTKQHWIDSGTSGSDTCGVAIKSDKCSFVIYPLEIPTIWGDEGKLILRCTTTPHNSIAREDFNGKNNTYNIVQQLATTNQYAAKYCENIKFSNGLKGYLPW